MAGSRSSKDPQKIVVEQIKPAGAVRWHTLDSTIKSGTLTVVYYDVSFRNGCFKIRIFSKVDEPRYGKQAALKLSNGLFSICNPDDAGMFSGQLL